MWNSIVRFVAIFVLLAGCDETIIENNFPSGGGSVFSNDLLHADLVGRVLQNESSAKVIVSQIAPIDSTLINPLNGTFVFRNLRAGNYDLKILADKYRYYTRSNVMLQGGSIIYVGDIDLSTVPDLIAGFYPEDNSEIVHDWRYGRITVSVTFTHPMDRESVEGAFSTNPPSEGIFYWGVYTRAPYNYLYSYASPFSDYAYGRPEPGATITTFSKITSMTYVLAQKDSYVDTMYTVSIATSAHDTSGNHLRFPLSFSFRTVQSYQTVYGIQTEPTHGDINVSPMSYGGIRLTFPRRMDPSSTEAATTVSPAMNHMILWPSGNVMTIYTGGPMLTDTTITVRVNSSARDLDGIPLGKDFSFSFRTAPFELTSTYPRNAELFVSPFQQISLYFNTYVIKSTVESAFSISPSISGAISYGGYSDYENKNQINFTPSAAMAPNTKYTVTISTSAKDMYGVALKQPYSFSFVTRPQ